jgi:hypothetical protein
MDHQYPLAVYGVAGCGGTMTRCGAPYGTPYGPYGLADATPTAPAPVSPGFLASLPSWWPYGGIFLGGALAITGIVLMATKK